jgi:hypothetical protein
MVTRRSPGDSVEAGKRVDEIPVGHERDGTKVPKIAVSYQEVSRRQRHL